MKNYEKPFILTADTLAEGIYATGMSGDNSGDCWIMSYSNVPGNNTTNNPGWNKSGWKIDAKHGCVEHISFSTTMCLSIGVEAVDRVVIEGVEVSAGNTGHSWDHAVDGKADEWKFEVKVEPYAIKIIRRCHGNAYSGGPVTDQFTIDVLIYSKTGASQITGITYYCEHRKNVQGGFD